MVAAVEEFRNYHRKDNMLVKVRDDLMSATRIGVMAIRHARQTALGSVAGNPQGRGPTMARGLDYDIWNPTGGGQVAEDRFGRGGLARGLDYSPWGDD